MLSLELEFAVPRLLIGEVIQRVRYDVADVVDVTIDPATPNEVKYTLKPGADEDQLRTKIIAVIDGACKGFRGIPVKRLWENVRDTKRVADVWKQLKARGELFDEGPGQVVLTGQALQLMEWFDRMFAGWAAEHGFAPQSYPVLIPAAVLERAEYFASFPQYLTFAAHFPEDTAHIKKHLDVDRSKGIEGLAPAVQVLSPAVCYHLYPQIADKAVPDKVPVKVTARGRCFRYETVNMSPLERQWDFSMREIIFVGTADAVEKFRRQFIDLAEGLVERLQLDGYIESAHDPFFTAEAEGKLVLQRMKHLKYELRLSLEEHDKSSAVASFNNHEDFFGRAFGVRLANGEPAHSGCVAFGLERWLNAFLCQHGLDRTHWPRPVLEAMERADAKWLGRGRPGEEEGDHYRERGDRPFRPRGSDDREERPRFGDRGERYRDREDRPRRPFRPRGEGGGDDRPRRPFRDRPPRRDDAGSPEPGRRPFGDRPPRRDGPPGEDRPRRPFGDRPPRRDGPPGGRGPRPGGPGGKRPFGRKPPFRKGPPRE